MRSSIASAGTLGNKLRRLAVNLSVSSQTAGMEDFVARFFSSSSSSSSSQPQQQQPRQVPDPDEPNPQVDKPPLPSRAAPAASRAKRREAKKRSELRSEVETVAGSRSDQQHQQQHQPTRSHSSQHHHQQRHTAVDENEIGQQQQEATHHHDHDEAEEIRQEIFENLQNEQQQLQQQKPPTTLRHLDSLIQKKLQQKQQQQAAEVEQQKQQQDKQKQKHSSSDNRSLVEIFDEVVSAQMVNQPDEDVITIVIRSNVPEERRLFEYFVCGELWFMSLMGADTSYMTSDDWATRIAGGAKIAIDALVTEPRPVDAKEICLSTRDDLNVYFMPDFSKHGGVGITLDEMRKIFYLKSVDKKNANKSETNDKDEHNNSSSSSTSLIPARSLILTSDQCFSPDQENDVLAIPFESNGMKLAHPVTNNNNNKNDTRDVGSHHQHHRHLETLSLQALSDKRTGRTDPIDPEEGEIVAGRFRIDQKVGSATFSDAYAVTLTNSNGEVADEDTAPVACIKCIKQEFFDQSLDEVRLLTMINEEAQRRYDTAINLLNDHAEKTSSSSAGGGAGLDETTPELTNAVRMSYYECGADACHVVRLADAFYFRHRMFVVTELLKENLYETTCAVAHEDPYWFDLPRLAMITKQITTALELIHSLGLVHCDLKPENIMVKSHSRCRVKLIDFGSSVYLHERFSSYVQSRSYRAPEVVLGAAYDGRVDMWSLGGVLVELASRGEILFRSTTLSNMLARIVSVCGPLPPSLMYAGSHADCVATRSGALFAQYGEVDDERYERFDQHPYFSTAQSVSSKIERERIAANLNREQRNHLGSEDEAAVEEEEDILMFDNNNNTIGEEESYFSDYADPDKRQEIWMHFPVFRGIPKEEVQNRQALWKIDRTTRPQDQQTNAGWSDIYEPNGRIEHLLENNGGWDIAAIAYSDATANEPVAPELLFLDFVKKCLILDPSERPTSAEMLHHPFISVFGTNEEDALLHGDRNGHRTANMNMEAAEEEQQSPSMMNHQQQQQQYNEDFDEDDIEDDDGF